MELIDLENFIDGNYAAQQNAAIDLNLARLLDGNTEIVFSNGLRYDYNYGAQNSVFLHVPGDDTGVLAYDINVSVNDSSVWKSAWNWDAGGDITVNLKFSDENAGNAVAQSGKLDSGVANIYRWDYSETQGDSLYIIVGALQGSGKIARITEAIADADSAALVGIKATIASPANEISWYYDADLNYSQGDVNLNRKLELGRA
ncbi:MAG: hypothetical protein JW772_00575, partial [Candidatus Diapherotrites archaeon]|nr:hypothetical protein [Candidatus Diapherotrites archaeon]